MFVTDLSITEDDGRVDRAFQAVTNDHLIKAEKKRSTSSDSTKQQVKLSISLFSMLLLVMTI